MAGAGRFMGLNRAIFSIFLAAVVILLISSHDTYASRQHNVRAVAPREIVHNSGTFNVASIPSKRVSLTLWSSDDAASRLENIQKAESAAKDPDWTHIGVNIDDSPELFREFLKRDKLDASPTQFLATDEVAHSLESTYGYGTWYY